MPVKKDGLGLLNLGMSENEKYPSSQRGSAELIWATTGGGAFSNIDHLLEIGEGMRDRQKHQDDAKKTKLKGLVR